MDERPDTITNDKWKQILNSAVDGAALVLTNTEGTVVWTNESYSELSGYSLEEVLGTQMKLLRWERQNRSFYIEVWSTIRSGATWEGQVVNQRKDGSRYLEAVEIKPITDKTGSITHFLVIKTDITEEETSTETFPQYENPNQVIEDDFTEPMAQLTEIAKALDQARSQMSAMLDAANDGMMLLSPAGEILRVNESFCKMFSVTQNGVLNHHYADHAEHWRRVFGNERIIDLILDESESENSEKMTFIQEWPVRREFQVYSASVRDTEDEYVGELIVFRDISPEREAERLKSEFVSLVTHEFRTPLTSIIGYVELMLEGDTGKITNEQRDFLEIVSRNADYLSELVDELMDVSRIEAGAVKLDIKEFNLTTVVEDVVDGMRPRMEKKDQNLSIEIPKDLPKVEADERKTSQIILNLVSNAHKYTPPGGNITVTAASEADYVRVDVSDNGIGLSDEEMEKLFSKFFRAENPQTTKIDGTGLGLWITRSFVEMQGGEIFVESEPGNGSTFSFTIPLS
ncbi:MAG: PAS domain S-box protein [Candidatus Thorarchaeota archaeon]|nr:PAS domain S-box protein [Candidatus Thorarchaeota archaeon]